MARKPIAYVVLIIVLGAMIGSLFGQLLTLALPEGVVKDFFLKEAVLAIGPGTLGIGFLEFTIGFKIILNGIGFFGILVAVYLLRWY